MTKRPAPAVLRKGAIVRVAGATLPARVAAVSYVDLRYDDRRVERWFGPGSDSGHLVADTEGLVAWGEEVIDTQAGCLVEELALSYTGVTSALVREAPVEIVVRWGDAHDDSGAGPAPTSLRRRPGPAG